MDNEDLRTLIRTKLSDGRLPIDSAPRLCGGSGREETCAACETTITTDQLTVEGIPSRQTVACITLHVVCFNVWNQEIRAIESVRLKSLTAATERRQREHVCPDCGGRRIHGVTRRRALDFLMGLIGRRVYVCWACRLRFYDRPSRPHAA
jgi:hypothetical protein